MLFLIQDQGQRQNIFTKSNSNPVRNLKIVVGKDDILDETIVMTKMGVSLGLSLNIHFRHKEDDLAPIPL